MQIIESKLKFNGAFSTNNPLNIIIHHALAKKCTIQDVHQWHLNKGWLGFGYHYFIAKDGSVYKGRPDWASGAQCEEQNMNKLSIGVCLEVCYEEYKDQIEKEVPKAQLQALKELVLYLSKKYNIPITKVYPHRHFATYKKCPGNYFPWDNFIKSLEVKNDPDKWKYEGLKILFDNELINDYDGWKMKIDEPMPVWAITIILSRVYQKLKG